LFRISCFGFFFQRFQAILDPRFGGLSKIPFLWYMLIVIREGVFSMIAFDLICANGHKFECWFKTGGSYEEQKAGGVIMCPICNDSNVEKAISPIAIRRHGAVKPKQKKRRKGRPLSGPAAVYDYVNKNFEDVGPNFAREALRIHHGEAEERMIRGVTLPQEEEVLKEEGVPFLKIPVIKRMDN